MARSNPHRRNFLIMAIGFGLCVGAGHSQETQEEHRRPVVEEVRDNKPIKSSFGEVFASVEKAQPNRRAGLRSSLLSQSMQVVPVVVIVDSPSAYLEAIAGWEGPVRYPVMFDDGSDLSREHIARFVRAFEPERVLRLKGGGEIPWGSSLAERKAAIDTSLAASIHQSEPEWETTLQKIAESGIVSPGVVVIDPMDRLWAGGLALAAGRLQPIIFVKGPQTYAGELDPGRAQGLNQAIEQGLIRIGRSFDQIGDQTDAITLAFRVPVKIRTGPDERSRLATTDRIGRLDDSLGGMRWAWCGQLHGSTSTSVYQAMSSLFLELDSAFIWDGYPDDGDWARYDGTETGDALSGAGIAVELFDSPRTSLAGLKGRASSGPVDSAMIFMNTKGSHVYFDLPMSPEGQGKPGDLPVLARPSVLHIVHSFSLTTPRNPRTVGGRWLERGVYLYAGSVDEPYLSGFVPTPTVARRLLGQLPFASAVHYDDGQAWKIAVIGDPLKTIVPCGKRLSVPGDQMETMFDGTKVVFIEDRAKERLKEGDYSGAIEDFVFVGHDESVVRLAKALIQDKPEAIDDAGSKAIIQAAMRLGEHELVIDCYERLSVEARADRMTLDVLWMAGRYMMLRFDDRRAEALLRTGLRNGQEIQDAEDLAQAIKRRSLSDAVEFLESVRPMLKGSSQISSLNNALKRLRR